jgi:hypothetical protein
MQMATETDDPRFANSALVAEWEALANSMVERGHSTSDIADAALALAISMNVLVLGKAKAACHVLQVGAQLAIESDVASLIGGTRH